ncbi:sigma E protease regulator RseP [Shewanella intestini]|uniref:Zinc metalloprotease n=1 Tax=Shewanella intestini TaxID=2017544 RepID=A0ABS5HYC9_9GAMM|nr:MULTISPECIES: sigma E protease regulator RseP [Shewanella]MBR9726795.1 sigma E protease regulator RseP [Shewanella intestini]MRG34639.1 sigma E protease regulator RseP [Shewanella sp. XMDDZSB0408]
MFDFIWNLGSFIVALGVLITVHEYGHFWVARRCGVKVERFSIGFGKALWRRVGKDGTEYVVAAIPLGGYVKMLDERVEDVPDELKHQAFNRKTVWQRIAIVAAGPIANFIFAFFALYLKFLIGVPSLIPVIDSTQAGSPAAIIKVDGLQRVMAVSGKPVKTWSDVNLAIVGHIGDDSIDFTVGPVDADSTTIGRQYQLDISQWKFDPDKQSPISALGLGIFRPQIEPIIANVAKDSAAELAGLQVGDEIVSINAQPYTSWSSFVTQVQQAIDQKVVMKINRQGQQLLLDVYPQTKQDASGQLVAMIGISPTAGQWPQAMQFDMQYDLFESIPAAFNSTWDITTLTLKMIGKLFTGDVSVKSLSGPISIAQGAGASATIGLAFFLGFVALISVNLGIINLMPLPVLDGGHLMYYFIEVISGRPVPEKVQEVGFKVGAVLLLMLMSVSLFNDFSRL